MSNLTTLIPKDGDEDGEEFAFTELNIRTVSNGWILHSLDDEGGECVEVFSFKDAKNLMESIAEALKADD